MILLFRACWLLMLLPLPLHLSNLLLLVLLLSQQLLLLLLLLRS